LYSNDSVTISNQAGDDHNRLLSFANVIVNLNNASVSNNGAYGTCIFLINSDAVFTNCTISSSAEECRNIFNGGGDIIINGTTLITTSGSSSSCIINNEGNLNIEGGTLSSSGTSSTVIYNNLGVVNVSDGTVSSVSDSSKLILNDNLSGTVNISLNANLTSSGISSNCIYNKGTLNISSGNIVNTGDYGGSASIKNIESISGEINISGGHLESSGDSHCVISTVNTDLIIEGGGVTFCQRPL